MAEPTEIQATILLHESKKYATKQKNPDLDTLVKIPVLPDFNMKPTKSKSMGW